MSTSDRVRFAAEQEAVIKVLKTRFQNLSAEEVAKLANQILIAIDETIDL